MKHVETIIIGGGPGGSSAAWYLRKRGHDVLILDKATFPRLKLCAGWITSQVLKDLEFEPVDYPHSFMKLDVRVHIRGIPFAIKSLPTEGDVCSIRRTEFDNWLLERSGAPVVQHMVKSIRQDGEHYIIDDKYSCRNLIGAGGTMCPVRRAFFPENRRKFRQIVTLEREFEYPQRQDICHLYFMHFGTKGYAWYFPKGDGGLNVGIGAKANYYKSNDINIHEKFSEFLLLLVKEGRLDRGTAESLENSGHPYYLNSWHGEVKKDNCYLIGDSAGLATMDLGEGIGPAIESAFMAAQEILGTGEYLKEDVSQFTSSGHFQKFVKWLVMPKPA